MKGYPESSISYPANATRIYINLRALHKGRDVLKQKAPPRFTTQRSFFSFSYFLILLFSHSPMLPHDASGMSTDGGDECRQHCNHDVNDALQRPLCTFIHFFLLSFCGSLILIFFNFLIFQLNPSEGTRPSTRFR